MNADIKIYVGQIWKVITSELWDSGVKINEDRGRSIKYNLKKNEKIEIRYPFKWHYRTKDGIYLHNFELEIKKHCELYGIIHEDILRKNKHTLKEILEDELFYKV